MGKKKSKLLPNPVPGTCLYEISPEEGGASDIEAMWLAEDEWVEQMESK